VPEPFNPLDTSWLDHDVDDVDYDNDGDLPVKEVQTKSKSSRVRRTVEWDATLEPSRPILEDERDRARLQVWAKGESRTVGAGRSIGVSAVTGRGKRKPGGSVTSGSHRPSVGSSSSAKYPSKLTKTSSALSAVSTSKRNKFLH